MLLQSLKDIDGNAEIVDAVYCGEWPFSRMKGLLFSMYPSFAGLGNRSAMGSYPS